MDIIISANEEILQMIREIPVDENGKADSDRFKTLVLNITNRKERNDANDEI